MFTRIFSIVLLFIIKCRFPSSKSIATIIRTKYGDSVLAKIRKLEKLDLKYRKCKLDLEFLELCLSNNIIPKFLNFKVSNNVLRSSKTYHACQLNLLKQEIVNKKSQCRTKEKEFNSLRNELTKCLTVIDFVYVVSIFLKSNDKILTKIQQVHKKKLYNLGYFEKDKTSNDPDQVIINYSSYTLTDTEKSLLSKGLNFSLPPRFLNYGGYMAPFELLYKEVKSEPMVPDELDLMKINIKRCAYNSFKRYNFFKELNLTKDEFQALKSLSSCKTIVIQKSDKGNSVVIIDKDAYLSKMSELISDSSKFEEIQVKEDKDYNFMVKVKARVDEVITFLYKKGSIDDSTKQSLTPDGPNPARLYGLPKIHKKLENGLPKYRPIISQIGSATYKLAKFLLPLIECSTINDYTIKDSFHFTSMLESQNHHLYMASLDVESLFTNIPLEETIDIVTNRVYDNNKRKVNGIWKRDFKDLLRLATKESVFYFNGRYFKQKDGVAMGSPLGPALANAFLAHHEVKWLQDCPNSFAPILYRRYVDDIFVLMCSQDQVKSLQEYFNSKHHKIKFTYELEKSDTLAFLDVNIYRDNGRFTTSIHRKDTFSGVYSNFDSFIPEDYKRGLVLTLLHRAYVINSCYDGIHKEITKLKDILQRNRYPERFIERCIEKFFNKLYDKRPPIQTAQRKEVLIMLPYLGSLSLPLKKTLMRSIKIPTVKLKMIFLPGNKLSSYFKFKDDFPSSLKSGVVYKYECAKCKFCYVGSTFRYLVKRIEEHLHVSALTGKPLSGLEIHAPMQHSRSCEVINSASNFSILCTEKNRYLLRLKESLFINRIKPQLNTMTESMNLHLFT